MVPTSTLFKNINLTFEVHRVCKTWASVVGMVVTGSWCRSLGTAAESERTSRTCGCRCL